MAAPILRQMSKHLKNAHNGAILRVKKAPSCPNRTAVFTENGGVLSEPEKTPLGLVKVMMVVVPSLALGANISKNGAAFLEENDIFVPDDDDD